VPAPTTTEVGEDFIDASVRLVQFDHHASLVLGEFVLPIIGSLGSLGFYACLLLLERLDITDQVASDDFPEVARGGLSPLLLERRRHRGRCAERKSSLLP
jgi:hypothetical protein